MNRAVIRGGVVVRDIRAAEGTVYTEGERIAAVVPPDEKPAWEKENCVEINAEGCLVFPGLIDIHIHGAMGRDFIQGPPALKPASENLARDGVTSFAASLTVVSHEAMLELLRSYAPYCGTQVSAAGARFLGVHSEGPYISAKYKALMDERFIRPPSVKELNEMIAAAGGGLVLMTFSPHWQGGTDDGCVETLLKTANAAGLGMMIGHSEADADAAGRALDNGAAGFTHLYNAMSGHHHRNEGVVTAALSDGRGYAEIIADTVHVSPRGLIIAYRLLGNRLILVSDAMPGKSMPDGDFVFSGLDCVKKDGKAWVKASGRLAGSVTPLNQGIRNMAGICGAGLCELAAMASANPAKLLGLYSKTGSLEAGKLADIALFSKDFDPVLTMAGGAIIWKDAGAERI
jgi:N-acetylglucosamine-6-phosphate deacetylase